MRNLESQLQISCVTWFRMQYPKYAKLLFAIPNGGKRSVITATILKREGALAGVADLFFAMPCDRYHGLFIEIKFGKGKQSEAQKDFEQAIINQCYEYKVITDFDQFKNLIESYLL